MLLAAASAAQPAAPSPAPGTPPRALNFSALFAKAGAAPAPAQPSAPAAPQAAGNGGDRASQSNGSVLTAATADPGSDVSASVTPRDDEDGAACGAGGDGDVAAALHELSVGDDNAVH